VGLATSYSKSDDSMGRFVSCVPDEASDSWSDRDEVNVTMCCRACVAVCLFVFRNEGRVSVEKGREVVMLIKSCEGLRRGERENVGSVR